MPGLIQPFPDTSTLSCLFGQQFSPKLLATVATPDPQARARAVLSVLLASEQPAWVRLGHAVVPAAARHGGRRHCVLTWNEESALLDAVEQRARLGEQVTVELLRGELASLTGRCVVVGSVHRLLRRHGWVWVPRARRRRRSAA